MLVSYSFPQQTAKSLADLTKGTPLWDATGLMPSADRPSNTVSSYASVHDTLSAKSKSYATKFKQFVLDYAIEWDKVVRTRVEGGLKKAEALRRELDHYQKKVEALRLTTNQALAKGKTVAPATAERLGRNEEKLISSKQGYNKIATDLCILMEEVTERAWRDLHPLLIKCAQFDMTMSSDESSILSALNQSVSALKLVATEKGLSPQARLKDIASLNPELLSTRPGGVSGLMITSGGEPLAGSSMAMPPGSVGPQGLGGYPVQLSSGSEPPPPYALAQTTSFNSYASAPASGNFGVEPLSTMSMLSISQASVPAPTYEDMYAANHSTAMSVHSAPPGNYQSPASRMSSFNDSSVYSAQSAYSGAPVAAAPAAPPPPPPRSAPLPPSYGAPQSYGALQSYGAPPQNYGAPPQNYGAPPQNYGAPQSYGAPSNGYGAPNSYGAPPMADARAMGPAHGQSYHPPQSMNSSPFDEPANADPYRNY